MIAAGVSFFSYGKAEAAGNVYRLPVFETSDIHGYMAEVSGNSNEYRLAYISDKVRDARSETGIYRKDRALLLDGGDIFQGNTMSNFLKGSSLSAAFTLMDYDAAALGNHEFDWGVHTVVDDDATLLDSGFDEEPVVNSVPIVCCNLYYKREKAPFTHDYVIIEKTAADGEGNEITVRIGVIGFTEDYSSSIMYSQFTGAGYTVLVNYTEANRIAEELESTGAADATILLTHGDALNAANGIGANSKIDLVLGGHMHTSASGKTVFGVPYLQPAGYATAFCKAELTFSAENGKPKLNAVENVQCISTTAAGGKLIPNEANESELDPKIVALTNRVIAEIQDLLDTRVGYITTEVRKSDILPGSGGRATSAGNWMASIIRRSVGADVGFMNSGGIRTEFRLTGFSWNRPITASDVYTMFPFNNLIYCYEVTYRDLLDLLTYSLTPKGAGLVSYMVGIDCYYTGTRVQALAVDGKAIYMNGQWVGDWADRKLKIAASEFLATTNRPDGGLSNPLLAWNRSGKLVSNDTVDVEGAFRVFDEESAANHWELSVDLKAYLIEGSFTGEKWTPADEKSTDPADMEPTEGETVPEPEPVVKEKDHTLTILFGIAAVLMIGGIVAVVILTKMISKRKQEETT
ncbi:MAG: bifunctional metallophosphatase/5'-nucleotidase [Lachnospiraceae bacterium]|nr:bifunctional metallophosphatase/5'-nucleotidase [Lachnospiraceae bacterium]